MRIEDALRSDHHGGMTEAGLSAFRDSYLRYEVSSIGTVGARAALERLTESGAPATSQAATSAFHTFGKIRWRNVWPDSSGRSRGLLLHCRIGNRGPTPTRD